MDLQMNNSLKFGIIFAICASPFALGIAGYLVSNSIWLALYWNSKYFAFKGALFLIEIAAFYLGTIYSKTKNK